MAKKKREDFYKLLLYVIFTLLNSRVDTEVKSVLGRADVVVKTNADIYVLELKVDDSVDNALAQIDSKGYAIPYEADGRKVTKCGVSIASEARNIVHWRVTDEEGKHHRRAEVQLRKRLLIINLLYTTMNKMTNIDPTHL